MAFFKGLGKEVPNRHQVVPQVSNYVPEVHPIIRTLFAPDPITGKPCPDLMYQYSADHSPAVADFIKNNLAVTQQHGVESSDPDVVLELERGRRESVDQYAERLSDFFNTLNNSE